MAAGKDAKIKKLTTLADIKCDPSLYDLVILGTPIWAGTLSSATRTYIVNNKSKFKQVAFFCTNGSGGQQLFAEMEALCERRPVSALVLPQTEVKKGVYQDKLRQFAEGLQEP
jgi:menaquinone-dependent protoporphyrinogen IX oxidase